ncbi:MAG: S8 family serine peptidase, partial [Actinomycetia bacterium]|nr:S8 family serine peptidase [Actinomycetes bacterium]
TDENGHGAHMAGIVLNSEQGTSTPKFNGVAPDADLIMVKAFDANGAGSYSDVIRGMQWILDHQAFYGIRVVNLSLSAPVASYYWDDPLNQTVMAAWQAGLVVVASAGNTGPDPMSVGVPGNLPYVITVGAMTDNYTPGDGTDDFLASWSATGPSVEAFLKPEVLAPGGHMVSKMPESSSIA